MGNDTSEHKNLILIETNSGKYVGVCKGKCTPRSGITIKKMCIFVEYGDGTSGMVVDTLSTGKSYFSPQNINRVSPASPYLNDLYNMVWENYKNRTTKYEDMEGHPVTNDTVH